MVQTTVQFTLTIGTSARRARRLDASDSVDLMSLAEACANVLQNEGYQIKTSAVTLSFAADHASSILVVVVVPDSDGQARVRLALGPHHKGPTAPRVDSARFNSVPCCVQAVVDFVGETQFSEGVLNNYTGVVVRNAMTAVDDAVGDAAVVVAIAVLAAAQTVAELKGDAVNTALEDAIAALSAANVASLASDYVPEAEATVQAALSAAEDELVDAATVAAATAALTAASNVLSITEANGFSVADFRPLVDALQAAIASGSHDILYLQVRRRKIELHQHNLPRVVMSFLLIFVLSSDADVFGCRRRAGRRQRGT